MDVVPFHTIELWHLIVLSFIPYPAKRSFYLYLFALHTDLLLTVSFTPNHTVPPDVLKEQHTFSTICEITVKPKPQHYRTLHPTSSLEKISAMTCLCFHQNNPNLVYKLRVNRCFSGWRCWQGTLWKHCITTQ